MNDQTGVLRSERLLLAAEDEAMLADVYCGTVEIE